MSSIEDSEARSEGAQSSRMLSFRFEERRWGAMEGLQQFNNRFTKLIAMLLIDELKMDSEQLFKLLYVDARLLVSQ